jgi:hypothetical protein
MKNMWLTQWFEHIYILIYIERVMVRFSLVDEYATIVLTQFFRMSCECFKIEVPIDFASKDVG